MKYRGYINIKMWILVEKYQNMEVSMNGGTPKIDGLFHGKSQSKMDDARVPRWIFSTSIWINRLMIGLLSIQIWGDNVDRTDDGISWDYEPPPYFDTSTLISTF